MTTADLHELERVPPIGGAGQERCSWGPGDRRREQMAYFGLVGGGMYLYLGGRGILARAAMVRRGLRIGSPENVRLGYVFSAVRAAMALATIVAAIVSIQS